MTAPIVIKVVAKTAKVAARTVNPVRITPPDGARVVLVPSGQPGQPGPPGPPGELTPEEKAALADDAAEEVLADLEPPVNLVIVFENSLA